MEALQHSVSAKDAAGREVSDALSHPVTHRKRSILLPSSTDVDFTPASNSSSGKLIITLLWHFSKGKTGFKSCLHWQISCSDDACASEPLPWLQRPKMRDQLSPGQKCRVRVRAGGGPSGHTG